MKPFPTLCFLWAASLCGAPSESMPNPALGKSTAPVATESQEVIPCAPEPLPLSPPDKNWYFEVKPGYYHFTTPLMRQIFGDGGFTIRAETGYRFAKPFMVWLDAGYFHKDGWVIGGYETSSLTLGTLTIGIKTLFYFNPSVAVYMGAGPRLFLMLMNNESPYVRGEDNEIGIGGGFNAGFWFFPFPKARNLFLDLFVDYSAKDMGLEEDEVSSETFDINLSGLTAGLGVGIRF